MRACMWWWGRRCACMSCCAAGTCKRSQSACFVLDEADKMLSRGYKGLVYDIFELLPPTLQVGAVMPHGAC